LVEQGYVAAILSVVQRYRHLSSRRHDKAREEHEAFASREKFVTFVEVFVTS